MTPLEKDIEKALGRMVGRHGGMCLKWTCPGWAGVPDRIILLPGGRIMFAELKRPKGGEFGKLQQWWAEKLSALGFVHVLVRTHADVKAIEVAIMYPGGRPQHHVGYTGKCFMVDEGVCGDE